MPLRGVFVLILVHGIENRGANHIGGRGLVKCCTILGVTMKNRTFHPLVGSGFAYGLAHARVAA